MMRSGEFVLRCGGHHAKVWDDRTIFIRPPPPYSESQGSSKESPRWVRTAVSVTVRSHCESASEFARSIRSAIRSIRGLSSMVLVCGPVGWSCHFPSVFHTRSTRYRRSRRSRRSWPCSVTGTERSVQGWWVFLPCTPRATLLTLHCPVSIKQRGDTMLFLCFFDPDLRRSDSKIV